MISTTPWQHAPSDSKQEIVVPVCRAADGSEIGLRLLVTRGAADGPVLLLLAAVHGDEYEGPMAIWNVYQEIDTRRLRGTLVMLPVTNLPAYAAGMRVNPADPKDLARTFPGSPVGSTTERIADRVQQSLIAHADFLLDLHSAGRFYRIDPWAGYALVSDAGILDRQRQAAAVLGYPIVWGTALLPGRSLWAAYEHRVPALYVEAPGEGRAHPEDVARNRVAIYQLLRFLEMLAGPLEPGAPSVIVEDDRPEAGHLQIQIVAGHGGYFQSLVELSQRVEAGQRFGRIVDPAGSSLQDVTAPNAGRVVFLRTFPVVQPGDSLGLVLEQT